MRDSAGIQIVESTAPAWEKGEAWRVDPAPILTIGVLEGLEEYQLFRAFSPVRTSRGEIVVVNERYGVRISEVTRPDEAGTVSYGEG